MNAVVFPLTPTTLKTGEFGLLLELREPAGVMHDVVLERFYSVADDRFLIDDECPLDELTVALAFGRADLVLERALFGEEPHAGVAVDRLAEPSVAGVTGEFVADGLEVRCEIAEGCF